VFPLIGELLRNLNLQEQRRAVELVGGTRLLMFPRLLQIRAVARTIERYFALLATTLRANASVDGGTEAFLFANVADRATQIAVLLFSIIALEMGHRPLAISNWQLAASTGELTSRAGARGRSAKPAYCATGVNMSHWLIVNCQLLARSADDASRRE
jgi:hypothetical protein